MPSYARADARHCSAACRVAAYRARGRVARVARESPDELIDALGPLGEPVLVARIAQAARLDWRAALALLERRWPQRWAARDRTGVGRDDELLADLDVVDAGVLSDLGVD